MSRVVVQEFITLDGVIQGPGGVDEDTSGGFEHGGWMDAYDDDQGGEIILDWERKTEALLLGRTTYEIWAGAWGVWDENAEGGMGELTRTYNRVPKHVASRTLTELGWKNSRLLGDVPAEVARLKDETGGEIRVWGSANLIATLAAHDLVDEYRFMLAPVVLGTGKKLFREGAALARFTLTESIALPSGVLASTYRRNSD